MKYKNTFFVQSANKKYCTTNTILHSELKNHIFSGTDYLDYIAFGSGYGELESGQTSLKAFVGIQKAQLVDCNFDASKGACFVTKQITIDDAAFDGIQIVEMGFSAYNSPNPALINRAYFVDDKANSAPIIKKAGESITILGTIFLQTTEGYNFVAGENLLAKSLLGQGVNILNANLQIFEGSDGFDGSICADYDHFDWGEKFLLESELVEGQLKLTARLPLNNGIGDYVVFVNNEPVLRINCVELGNSAFSVNPSSSEFGVPYTNVKHLVKIMRMMTNISISNYRIENYPSRIISHSMPDFLIRLQPDTQPIYSPLGKYAILKGGKDIMVLGAASPNKLTHFNTACLPVDAQMRIDENGYIFCLGKDGKLFAYVSQKNIYKQVLLDYEYDFDIESIELSNNLMGQTYLALKPCDREEIVVQSIGYDQSHFFVQQSQTYAIAGLKKITPAADGYFYCSGGESLILQTLDSAITLNSNANYVPTLPFDSAGYFFWQQRENGQCELMHFSLAAYSNLGLLEQSNIQISPSLVFDRQAQSLAVYPSRSNQQNTIQFEDIEGFVNVVMLRFFVLFVFADGTTKIFRLDDGICRVTHSSLSTQSHDVTVYCKTFGLASKSGYYKFFATISCEPQSQ